MAVIRCDGGAFEDSGAEKGEASCGELVQERDSVQRMPAAQRKKMMAINSCFVGKPLTRADRPSSNPKLQIVLDEVDEKTGWRKIKEKKRKLVRISDENYERELKGQETVEVFLNRLFLGNTGTGKTTYARYYGRVLKSLHFLNNGEVVKKITGDFIGSHAGESQTKATQILDMAKGKVLVIDEAYNLNDNMFGKQVLDVLVEKVQGTESDDLAVLLIGYEHEMLEMLRTQNPGLTRRFPPQYAFYFEDYTEHELLDILEWNCTKRSVTCPYDVEEALLKQLALQKTQPNFGNVRW